MAKGIMGSTTSPLRWERAHYYVLFFSNAVSMALRTHSPMLIRRWSVIFLICSYCSGGIDIVSDFVKIACFMIFPPFLFLITKLSALSFIGLFRFTFQVGRQTDTVCSLDADFRPFKPRPMRSWSKLISDFIISTRVRTSISSATLAGCLLLALRNLSNWTMSAL